MLVEEGATKQILKSLREGKAEMEDVEKDWIAYDLFLQCMHSTQIKQVLVYKSKLSESSSRSSMVLSAINFCLFVSIDVSPHRRWRHIHIFGSKHTPIHIPNSKTTDTMMASSASFASIRVVGAKCFRSGSCFFAVHRAIGSLFAASNISD